MSNKYLDLLELEPGATKQDIKKAYRRLSKRYHPDLNKSPDAHDRFIELTEAYNFLMEVGPRPHQETVAYDYNPEANEYEEWRRRAKANARKRAMEEARLQQELIKKMLYSFQTAFMVIVLFNVLLTIDYLLPRKEVTDKIVKKERVIEGYRTKNYRYDRIRFTKYVMLFEPGKVFHLALDSAARIEATVFFDKPQTAFFNVNGSERKLTQVYGIYKVFGWLIPIVLLVAYLYLRVFRTLDTKLTLAIFMFILFIVQLVLFF